MSHSRFTRLLPLMTMTVLLGACSHMPSMPKAPTWLGGEKKEDEATAANKADRVAALPKLGQLQADDDAKDVALNLASPQKILSWDQVGSNPQGLSPHGTLAANLTSVLEAKIGDGAEFELGAVPQPIVTDQLVIAMDASGTISAHDVKDIRLVRWLAHMRDKELDDPLLGGGLAAENNILIATTSRGDIAAFSLANGKRLWFKALNTPIRSAPRLANGRAYIVTAESQTLSIDAETGTLLWGHRGINENAGYFVQTSPILASTQDTDIVITPYPSGEIYALSLEGGDELWSDSVTTQQRTRASGGLVGISTDLVSDGHVVYASGASGMTAAVKISSGQRLWEQPVATLNPPIVSGDAMFELSTGNQLVALSSMNGRVIWTRDLAPLLGEKKETRLFGPVLADGQLVIVSDHQELFRFDAKTGAPAAAVASVEIPEAVDNNPVMAGGALYLVTKDAHLFVLK